MRSRWKRTNRFQAIVAVLGLWGACTPGMAQTISNPSFESNSFTMSPGYYSQNGNGVIVGWVASGTTGLNPAGGSSPFADNSTAPDGNNVAFIQSGTNSSLSTVISNLTAHKTYTVNFRVNARSTGTPNLDITVGGKDIINTAIAAVGSNPYWYFAFNFTAAAPNEMMTLLNHATGDNTVLVDDFSIAPRKSGWSYAPWKGDTTSGVVKHRLYTHAYNFGSTNNAIINGVTFNGIAGGTPSSPGGPGQGQGPFSTVGLQNILNNDTNILTTGRGGSAVLARDFIFGGVFGGNSETIITIDGLTLGNSYVATIYSVGFHGDTNNGARAATFNVGNDRLTVNQDQFGYHNGIRVSYAYTATARSLSLTYVPLQGGGQTFHTYGFANYLVSRSGHAAFLIVTNLADSGPGTLRQVIANANPGDTITFGRSLSGQTILLTSGQLALNQNVTIDASSLPAGITVSGNHASRIFLIGGGTTVTLDSLTLTNGYAAGDYGGAIDVVCPGATLTLNNSTLSANVAVGGGGIFAGCQSTVTLNNSTLSGNSAGQLGGGIYLNGGTLALNNSTLSGNSAVDGGGGIFNHGTLEVNNSTLSGNSTVDGGGGIVNFGTLEVNNSTLSGNSASGLLAGNGGGGILSYGGTLTLNNSTLSGNSAATGGGGGIDNSSILLLTNTIVAGNFAAFETNIFGPFLGVNNLIDVNPRLAPLGNYGGPTQTMLPLPGSPAIDAGDDSVTKFLATDQRGFPRLSGAHVDIGSVEVQVRTAAQVIPGGFQFSDPAATNDPQRFYQVVSP